MFVCMELTLELILEWPKKSTGAVCDAKLYFSVSVLCSCSSYLT